MKIREMTENDFEKCADIIFTEFNKQGEGFTKDTALGRVKDTFVSGLALCAEEDGKVIGLVLATQCIYAKGKYVWIEELAVVEKFQKKRIGKNLMQKLEKTAKQKGINVISLNTRIKNCSFYKKIGFKETGYVHIEKEL